VSARRKLRHWWPALALCALGAAGQPLGAETVSWTLTNHNAVEYADELVRLGVKLAGPFDATRLVVLENGVEVPCQVEIHEGVPERVVRGDLWVCTTIRPAESHVYEVRSRAAAGAATAAARPRVRVDTRRPDRWVLANDRIRVEVPGEGASGVPGPILGIGGDGGVNLDNVSSWQVAGLKPKSFRAELIGAGPLFGKVRLRYEFESATPGGPTGVSEIMVTVGPRDPVARIEESHALVPGAHWTLNVTPASGARSGLARGWHRGPFQGDESLRELELKPGPRLGDTLMYLQPRWTQSFDEGWFFGATDGAQLVGAMVARAGRWEWPYDNLIDVRVTPRGDSAALVCPAWRGKRHWYLLAGQRALAEELNGLVRRVAFQPLDKLTHEYHLDWPGQPPGGFKGEFFYNGGITNPTGGIRGMGRSLLGNIRDGRLPRGNRALLSNFQVRLDPDWYGFYYNGWSPINPNFATDFLRVPILQCMGLRDHPEFARLARMAEAAFRMDMDYSITLPGGAGQESPGYTVHAMSSWQALAPLCKKHLGFDPTAWPRYRAAASFILRTSQPIGGGRRRILPLGDTHPPGPDVIELARRFGVHDRVEDFVTEELPGFGVVFRSRSGRQDENFLAFKAGPNRGHNHGDQLSFHYCGNGRRLAIDHMCSYAPRADQEHMHNRVAFTAGEFEFANMDGHERLIGFQTTPDADVAVGQVESNRLRRQPRTPQEVVWHPKGPYHQFDTPLVYRRAIVFVKNPAGGGAHDYFVIRDQHWGPEVKATWCLHVESNDCRRIGPLIDFGVMSVFVAAPEEFQFERFDWSFTKGRDGYSESTSGARLSRSGHATEFITLLYPGGKPPRMEAVPGGVRVEFGPGHTDEIVFGDALGAATANDQKPADAGRAALATVKRNGRLVTRLSVADIDFDRCQGEIGLFIPEAGYDFGPIPDWLVRQRSVIRAPALLFHEIP
jgi:hypothetical protein